MTQAPPASPLPPGPKDVAPADRARAQGLLAEWQPKWRLTRQDAIATAGSCFAQHVGQALRQAGARLIDAEPRPAALPAERARAFGYGVYTARYGNIYTPRQMLQLVEECQNPRPAPPEIWARDGRFHDALRPAIEPRGFVSGEEVARLRADHLARLRAALAGADLFIFTLGLTEAWEDRRSGRIYPICPGVIAGRFDAQRHVLRNFTQAEILGDLAALRRALQQLRPGLRMLLSVSPVPLTATASGRHVLLASNWSKAVLVSAAREMADAQPDVDYVPAYEIITDPRAGSRHFAANLRSIDPRAVAMVMGLFLQAQDLGEMPQIAAGPTAQAPTDAGPGASPGPSPGPGPDPDPDPELDPEDGLHCEERLLEAFRR